MSHSRLIQPAIKGLKKPISKYYCIKITDRRVRKLAEEVFDILFNPLYNKNMVVTDGKTNKSVGTVYTDLLGCIKEVRLVNRKSYLMELKEDIASYKSGIKRYNLYSKNKNQILSKDEIKDYRQAIVLANREVNTLEKDSNLNGYFIDVTPSSSKNYLDKSLLEFKIILIKENIKKESDNEIKITIGHEIAHAYLHLIVNYGFNYYHIDDLKFCNFIAKKWFKIK